MQSGSNQVVRRVLAGLLASLVLVAPFTIDAASAQDSCGVVSGDWTSVAAPSFPTGAKPLTAYAVHPLRPSLMFATNGTVVMRSNDGGCDWKVVYEPEAAALPVDAPGEAAIKSIVVPESPAGATMVFLLLDEQVGPALRPRLLRSVDGGGSWQPADAGLPPAGSASLLRIAPSDPQKLYLAISADDESTPEPRFPVEFLYGSDDGGTTWTLRSNFQRTVGAGVSDVKVDPANADEVWVGAATGLFHSSDGGRTYADVDEFAGEPAGPVDVFHREGPASVVAFKPGQGQGAASDDGGQTWLRISSPGIPTSIAHGHVALSRLISSVGRVWVYAPNIFSWVDARAPRPEVTGITADRSGIGFYGFTASTIEIYRGPVGASVKIPPEIEIRPDASLFPGGPPPPAGDPELTPDETVVRIPAGDSRTVPFNLKLPRVLSPVDVYFVVDTSSSQKPFIEAMVESIEGIVNGLNGSRVVARFGLAEYRNYPDADPPRLGPPGPSEPNFVYRRRVDLTTDMSVLQAALNSIQPDGGGHYNAQLAALYQTATGEGQDVEPPGMGIGRDVERNQHANFDKGSLRVALIVSDEAYEDDPYDGDRTPPDLPQFEEVRDALNAKDIKQVGISIESGGANHATGNTNPDDPEGWGMLKMALDTEALAPATGVDCDGDGSAEISEGRGLVCEMTKSQLEDGRGLAAAIVNLVQAVRTRSSVELSVGGRDQVIQKVAPAAYESVVAEATKALSFDVTFRCPLALAGERFPIELTATGLTKKATATAMVVCGAVEENEEPPSVLPLGPLVGLIPLVPPAPPPPVTELVSSTQAQAQSQAQAQAQAMMAAQEQEQPQLAFVHAMHRMKAEMGEEYAMSSYQPRDHIPAPALALGAATVLMSAAYGLLIMRPSLRLRGRSRR